jgi:MoaA/NifB/PqqE/SkfB family radical SAM enzyme
MFPNLRFVEIHGEGEPLLYPSFFEMAEFLRSRNIKTSAFTNGSLLNSENIQKLLKTGLEKIVISLDTVNPDRFKKIRGYELQTVLNGILLLIHKRNASKRSKPSIGIASTIFKDSIYDIPSLIYLCGLLSLDGGIGYHRLFVKILHTLLHRRPYSTNHVPERT